MMPTRRRRRAYRGRWSQADRHILDCGRNLLHLPGPSFADLDDPVAKVAWRDLGPDLVAEAISTTPGQRPKGWWKFDGIPKHGPRLRVATYSDDSPLPTTTTATPSARVGDSMFENQEQYLRRNGLLAFSEMKILAEWRAMK